MQTDSKGYGSKIQALKSQIVVTFVNKPPESPVLRCPGRGRTGATARPLAITEFSVEVVPGFDLAGLKIVPQINTGIRDIPMYHVYSGLFRFIYVFIQKIKWVNPSPFPLTFNTPQKPWV
jgi:hypothetical protein